MHAFLTRGVSACSQSVYRRLLAKTDKDYHIKQPYCTSNISHGRLSVSVKNSDGAPLISCNWNYPTTVFFGEQRTDEIAAACQQLHIDKPLVVTDSAVRLLPFANQVLDALGGPCCFTNFKPNPDEQDIANACAMFNDHHCDGIVALGGGASIDVAKTTALQAKQTRPLWDFEDIGENYLRADGQLIAPIIALPTTAGTGSEVGRAAVIVDSVVKTKRIIFHPQLMPSIVILDPLLTLSVPPSITAATGMDALAHNMEAYFSPRYHPMAEGIALEGLRLIKNHLLTAFNQGDNKEARAALLVASTMGATAFQKGLGLVHSLSHPVGARYNKHHGLLNALFMPYVLDFNRQHIADKAVRLALHLGLKNANIDGLIDWCVELNQYLKLPLRLKDIGIDDTDADIIAKHALIDPSSQTNPRPLTLADCKQVFCQAINGDLR